MARKQVVNPQGSQDTPRTDIPDDISVYVSEVDEEGTPPIQENIETFDINGTLEELVPVSRFTSNDYNTVVVGEETMYFGLDRGENIVGRGVYLLAVLKGAISILGATIHANPERYKVYALSSHGLPVIECVPVQNQEIVVETRTQESEHMFEPASKFRAIIRLDHINPNGLEILGQLAPPYKHLVSSVRENRSFQPLYEAPKSTPIFKPFQSWYRAAEKIALAIENVNMDPPRIMVIGPKSSGKSSFGKFLTNYILAELQNVHYLELDPGQPEYSPPGVLSLHAPTTFNFEPSYIHPHIPNVVKAFSLGFTSPKDDPSLYLKYSSSLFSEYQKSLISKPSSLIINTPGWIRGLGLDLMSQVAQNMAPTHVVYLGTAEARESIKMAVNCPDDRFYAVDTVLPSPSLAEIPTSKLTQSDLRAIQTMSYFHSLDFSKHLTTISPFNVPFGSNGITAVAVQNSEGIMHEDVELCINGTVVAIVVVDEDVDLEAMTIYTEGSLPWIPSDRLPQSLAAEMSRCIGLAVVQSVDGTSINLLTPIPLSVITQVYADKNQIVLVRGRIQLPLWELWNSEFESSPYLSFGKDVGKGSRGWRVRRNVMRRI